MTGSDAMTPLHPFRGLMGIVSVTTPPNYDCLSTESESQDNEETETAEFTI